jgi:hypothetical protein
MTELIVMISSGSGTWSEAAKVINSHNWEKVFIITNDFGARTFNRKENFEFVVINPEDSVEAISKKIFDGFNGRLGMEVALNMSSGSGKEHMALLSAVLKSGAGIRLISVNEKGIIEL